jgi:ATP-dependent DNA helicase RecG
LNEKRRLRDPHFDALTVQTATIADLDLNRFETEYLPRAFDHRVLAANDRSGEERLAALKMIASVDDPTPTVAGILVLGKNPQDFLRGAYVQFLRIGGSEWGDPVIDEERCDGSVLDQIMRLDEKLNAHNRTTVDFSSGPREIRRSTYPLQALQQLTRNAVMHRTYEGTESQVLVYWFDDHIEIISPGSPYGGITAETLGQPGLVAYRNPNLAEAMKVLGLAQRFGLGIATARRDLKDNQQPPLEFRVESDRVFCIVRERP